MCDKSRCICVYSPDAVGDQMRILNTTSDVILSICVSHGNAQNHLPLFAIDNVQERTVQNGPVVIELAISSSSVDPITLDLGDDYTSHLRFDVIRDRIRSEEVRLPRSGFAAPGKTTILPNSAFTKRIILNPILPSDKAGVYAISVQLNENLNEVLRSNQIFVTILPRSKDVIKTQCQTLVNRIKDGIDATTRYQAIRELSMFRDPAAVPYLKAALDIARSGGDLLVPSLVKIGSVESISDLDKVMRGSDPELAKYTRSQLMYLRSSTKSEQVRGKINQIISLPSTISP